LITPDLFATLKAELRGREFDARDTEDAPWVAVVNETAARRFWPDLPTSREAIGRRVAGGSGVDVHRDPTIHLPRPRASIQMNSTS